MIIFNIGRNFRINVAFIFLETQWNKVMLLLNNKFKEIKKEKENCTTLSSYINLITIVDSCYRFYLNNIRSRGKQTMLLKPCMET